MEAKRPLPKVEEGFWDKGRPRRVGRSEALRIVGFAFMGSAMMDYEVEESELLD